MADGVFKWSTIDKTLVYSDSLSDR